MAGKKRPYSKAAVAKQRLKNLAKARANSKRKTTKRVGRNPIQKALDDTKLTEMMNKGYSYDRMGKELGISKQQAHKDCMRLLQDELNKQTTNIELHRHRMLGQLRGVFSEAADAWERSQKDKESIETTQRVADALKSGQVLPQKGAAAGKPLQKKTSSTVVKREGQVGDPRFLAVMTKCLELEKELRGMQQPAEGGSDDMYKTTDDTRALLEQRLQALKQGQAAQAPIDVEASEVKTETIQ